MLDETSPLEGVTFAVVDVETTGLSPAIGDRICEIAVVRGRAGQILDSFTSLVNPQRAISPGARRVNGISNNMVYRAPVFADVAGEVRTLLQDTVLVAHNAGFDIGFLRNEMPPAAGGAEAIPRYVIDTLQLARLCYQFPSNALESIAAILKLRGHHNAHRALADAQTTWRVLTWFINDLRDRGLPLESLGDLLALQGRLDLTPRPYLPADAPSEIVPPVVNQAITEGLLLRLRYASPSGPPTDRLVAPRRVALERQSLYLVAYCHLRHEERTFRFDRILKLELCEQVPPLPLLPHRWDVAPDEAIAIQHRLAPRVERTPRLGDVRLLAGVDMSAKDVARAAVVLLSYPELETVEIARAERPLSMPYVPGLLSFREAPAILAAFEKLSRWPDLVMFDGQGIAHPRRLGIGAHIGLLLDLPSIGVAKSLFVGHGPDPGPSRGEWSELRDKGEVIGAQVRTKTNVKPVYISIGHRVDLPTAIHWVLAADAGYRLPEPTRRAHNAAAVAE